MDEFMGGALPHQELNRLVDAGALKVDTRYIKPASVDLPLAAEAYELATSFIPPYQKTLEFLDQHDIKYKPHDLAKPLKKGVPYLIRLDIKMDLPPGVWGLFSPKSSTGRIDIHARVLGEGITRYDFIPEGFTGVLWLLVVSRSFDVLVKPGTALTQLRLFTGSDGRLRGLEEIYKLQKLEKVLINGPRMQVDPWDGGIVLTVGFDFALDAWVAKDKAPLLDLTVKPGSLDPMEYFEPAQARGGKLVLKKDKFYILSTAEGVRIPNYLCAEFMAMDANTGEFRSHYAGFVDPGWGLASEKGRPLTLEVRPFEDTVIVHGQPVAKLFLDKLVYPAEMVYDGGQKDAHYTQQEGPRLGKWFRLGEKSRAG